jgi:predicted small secreted protein
VSALAVTGQTVYAGGSFTSVGGQPRNYIAAIDATTGSATGWNPDVAGLGNDVRDAITEVHALAVSGQTVYAGGRFNSIGGQTRHNVAALDPTTGALLNWNPDANGEVDALAVSGQSVYMGGRFTAIGGRQRHRLGAVDATSGQVTAWNPAPTSDGSSLVLALAVSGQTVYVGGAFDSIGGEPRTDLARR